MKTGIALLILVFLLVVGFSLMDAPAKLSAQPQRGNQRALPQAPFRTCDVPKTAGIYRGAITGGDGHISFVVFEDAQGTLTFNKLSVYCGWHDETFQIKRQ